MEVYVGLDGSLKRSEVCVVAVSGDVSWRGALDTHPEMIATALSRWRDSIAKPGLETGSTTPWLARGLTALGLPVVVMDARRAADALKARPVQTDRADALALAEMLRTGWYGAVFVKSEESHRLKALLLSRDQRVEDEAAGLRPGPWRASRPFDVRLPARAGTKRVDEAARAAVRGDDTPYACVAALLAALGAVEARGARRWTSASGRSSDARRRAGG